MRFGKISLICAMILTITGSCPLPVLAAEEDVVTADSPVSMEVSLGYGGNAKSGRYMPVNVDLESKSDVSFDGTLRVTAMETDYDIYDYDYPVSMEAGASDKETLDIPVGRADALYVTLLDAHGGELISKRMKLEVTTDIAELFVGVLSDRPEKLAYMDRVGVNYSSVRTRTFDMDASGMPDSVIGLDLLDVLVITDYDTKDLSVSQISAIWEWVREGGTLLIGTGARADDALAAFRFGLLDKAYSLPEERPVDMGAEYASNAPGDSSINLVCTDISLKGGASVISSEEFSILTTVAKGKGIVGVAAYDFTELSDFGQTHRTYVDKIFTSVLGEGKLNNLSSYMFSGNSSQFWSVQNMLNTGDVDKLPNLTIYIIVILAYIAMAGPGLYLYLKKKKQRRFYRTGVTAVSIVFSIAIYLMGMGTRYKDTFFTYATIVDTTENTMDESTYVNIRNPYSKAYTVSLDPTYDLLPITRNSSYEMAPVPRFTGKEAYRVRISNEEAATKVSVQNTAAFTSKYYSLKKQIPNQDHKGLKGDVTVVGQDIYGFVTNEYPFPVEKVGVLMYGKMVVIDELQPGETKALDGLSVINYPISNPYLVSARVTGSYRYQKADIGDPAYVLALSRTNILSFYMGEFSSLYNQEGRIVAFSRDQDSAQFLPEDSYETYGMAMFTSSVDVKTKRNGQTSQSALKKAPTVVSGQYYADSNSIYGADPVTLEYSLGNDLEVETLTFENPSEEFLNQNSYNYASMFAGTIYFYNHDTSEFDAMEQGKTVYTGRELTPYLSPGNTLTVKYVCTDTQENNWYVTLPMLTAAGKDK